MAISPKLLRFPLKIWETPKGAVSRFSGPSDSPISTFPLELFAVMDNTLRVVQERLRLQEERRQQILEAGQGHPQPPRQRETWWPTLINKYGTETELFRGVGVDRTVFEIDPACVSEVRLETRGRQSSIRSIRERLLFLLIFMGRGLIFWSLLFTP